MNISGQQIEYVLIFKIIKQVDLDDPLPQPTTTFRVSVQEKYF